jgi:hypothetical protein
MDVWTDFGGDTTLFTELYQVRAGVVIQKLQKTGEMAISARNRRLCMTAVIYIMLMRPFYFSIHNLAKPSLFEELFALAVWSLKQQVTVLFMCNTDGSDIPPPLVTGKHKSHIASRMSRYRLQNLKLIQILG